MQFLSLLIKLLLHHKEDDSEQKRASSRRFAIDLENAGPFLFKITQMLLFPFAVFLICWSTVLSAYCNVSFYFLGILRVMKYHFA